MASVRAETKRFMEELAHVYQQASKTMARMDVIDQAWGDAHIY